jgi:hypothetical protein
MVGLSVRKKYRPGLRQEMRFTVPLCFFAPSSAALTNVMLYVFVIITLARFLKLASFPARLTWITLPWLIVFAVSETFSALLPARSTPASGDVFV